MMTKKTVYELLKDRGIAAVCYSRAFGAVPRAYRIFSWYENKENPADYDDQVKECHRDGGHYEL